MSVTKWWAATRSRLRPRGRVTVVRIAVTALAVAFVAGGLAQAEVSTTAQSLLPSDDPAAENLTEAADAFGSDPVAVLLESPDPDRLLAGDALPRLLALEGKLSRLPQVAVVHGPGTALNQVAGQAQDLLAQISGRRDALRTMAEQQARNEGKPQKAVETAIAASTAEFDQRYGTLLAQGLPAGLPTLRNPKFAQSVLFDKSGVKPQWRYLAPSHHAVSILVRPRQGLDQDSVEHLVGAVRAEVNHSGLPAAHSTVTGTPTVAAALSGQVREELPLLGAAALIAVAASFVLLPLPGRWRHRLLPVIAAVSGAAFSVALFGWLGVPLSHGAITFLPTMLAFGTYYSIYLTSRATPKRVLVAALASAAGFAALVASPLPFVKQLGIAVAVGILAALGVSFALRRWSQPRLAPSGLMGPPMGSPRPVARRMAVLATVALLAGTGWACLPGIAVQADPQRMATGLGELDDAQHVESVLGASGEVSLVLRGNDVMTPQALKWFHAAEDRIVSQFGDRVTPTITFGGLFQFLGNNPTQPQLTAATQVLPPYLSGAVVRPERGMAQASFGLRMQDLESQRHLLATVRESLPPPPQGYRVELAGLPVMAARGYQLVSDGRYISNILGIAAAGLVLVLGLRHRRDAARAVLAAVLATGWGLALLAALGIPLSPLTVSLGSLTAATACEFAVILADAHRKADRRIKRAVLVASGVSAVGFLALTLSSLALVSQFGLIMAGSVLLSCAGAVVVVTVLPPRTKREQEFARPKPASSIGASA